MKHANTFPAVNDESVVQEEPNATVRPDQNRIELTQRGKKLPLPSRRYRALAGRDASVQSPVERYLASETKSTGRGMEGQPTLFSSVVADEGSSTSGDSRGGRNTFSSKQ